MKTQSKKQSKADKQMEAENNTRERTRGIFFFFFALKAFPLQDRGGPSRAPQ